MHKCMYASVEQSSDLSVHSCLLQIDRLNCLVMQLNFKLLGETDDWLFQISVKSVWLLLSSRLL